MALFRMERGLEERFRINHATLQIELGAMDCPLAPEERV
jgi:hypothetical protein